MRVSSGLRAMVVPLALRDRGATLATAGREVDARHHRAAQLVLEAPPADVPAGVRVNDGVERGHPVSARWAQRTLHPVRELPPLLGATANAREELAFDRLYAQQDLVATDQWDLFHVVRLCFLFDRLRVTRGCASFRLLLPPEVLKRSEEHTSELQSR